MRVEAPGFEDYRQTGITLRIDKAATPRLLPCAWASRKILSASRGLRPSPSTRLTA